MHQIDKRVFTIKWKNGEEIISREVPYDRFLFFAFGNNNSEQSLRGDAQTNNTAAREIVCELLNIDPPETIQPAQKRSFFSANGAFELVVDPRWKDDWVESDPLLTLKDREGNVLWQRTEDDFENFLYPMEALINDDGQYIVFGGNFGGYNVSDGEIEGIRIYDSRGKLIRFIKRCDLPLGISDLGNNRYYDEKRTKIQGHNLFFFTPKIREPIVFDVRTGKVLQGKIVKGQGSDDLYRKQFKEWSKKR